MIGFVVFCVKSAYFILKETYNRCGSISINQHEKLNFSIVTLEKAHISLEHRFRHSLPENNTLWLCIKIILVTGWVVVFSSSTIVEKSFDGIPSLPDSLI